MKSNRQGSAPTQTTMVLLARFVLFLERLWPALLPALGIIALFILVTLFDFWHYIPGAPHYFLLAGFAGALIISLVRDVARLDWPNRQQALERLEADSHLKHAPLRALEDKPLKQDDLDNPLWRAHQKRMKESTTSVRLDKAHAAGTEKRDPFALRYGVALLLVFAVFLAWGDIQPRFWQAFSPQLRSNAPVTVDLWIDPPGYTGKAPLTLLQSATPEDTTAQQIVVPEGSIFNVRIAGTGTRGIGRARINVNTADTDERVRLERTGNSAMGDALLTENSALVLSVQGKRMIWPVAVTPDTPPVVLFRDTPTITDENRVRMVVEIEDDYGIAEAQAIIRLDPEQSRPPDAPPFNESAVTEIETIAVTGITGNAGGRSVELDLTDHRWAGLTALIRIEVVDGAGNVAATLSEKLRLPTREFFNPLAQAIIHERRNLAVAPSSWPTTTRALDALTFAPDRYFDKPRDYLLLRTAYWDVVTGKGDNIEETVDRFWPLALQLEDQALELARRALEAAQQALREALERGASTGEIASLVEDLRLAMRNYIEALAESGTAIADDDAPSEELGTSDLNEMLDSINDLTQSGANNAARQMLSELEQMLSDLKISGDSSSDGATGRTGDQAGSDGTGDGVGNAGDNAPGSQALNAAGELIGRQRELADETFDALREEFGFDGAGGETPPLSELQKEQQALAEDLQGAIDQFGDEGVSEGARDVLDAFGEALEKMQGATEALEADNPNAANLLQEEALQSLRNGADQMAEEFMKAQEELADGEQGQRASDGTTGGETSALDPLGRPFGASPGNAIDIPDLSNPEKARELVEELRRRLAEPGRTKEEIEYLERLLRRF